MEHQSTFNMYKTVVTSEESWLGLGLIDDNEIEWFEVDVDSQKSQEVSGKTQIDFELIQDVKVIKRSTYAVLDLLGDVGGLFDALEILGKLFISVYFLLRGNPIEKYLLEAIFKVADDRNKQKKDIQKLADLKGRKPLKLSRKVFYCLRDRREKLLMDRGSNSINQELKIDRFLKRMKIINVAL